MRKKIVASAALFFTIFCSRIAFAEAQPTKKGFVPLEPVMSVAQIEPGMKAKVKTVLEGTKIYQFDATLLGVIPRKTSPKNLIVIHVDDKYLLENGGIAAGMSGSPVYVGEKLVGAIGYGWPFGDTSLGLVTPIEEMVKALNWPNKIPQFGVSQKVTAKPPEKKTPSADADSGDVKPAGALSQDAGADELAAEISDDIFIEEEKVKIEKDEVSVDVEAILKSISNDLAPDEDKDGKGNEGDGRDVSLNFPAKLRNNIALLMDTELAPLAMPLLVDGISSRMTQRLKQRLGVEVIQLGASSGVGRVNLNASIKPGMAIGASLAWGDFEVGGIGTLTALDKHGRFLAFGHGMFEKGAVAYAATEASIVKIIPSIETSFKLGYQGSIVGVVVQDRSEAIGGHLGRLASANSYTVRFHDIDTDRKILKRFQTVADPFISPALSTTGMLGIIDDLWGRMGEGTAILRYKFSGGHFVKGWTRTNVYFSEQDIVGEMTKEFEALSKIFALNQFQEIYPFGIELEIEVTRDPRVVYIEKIKIVGEKDSYAPGEEIELDVTLRPWRKPVAVKRLALKVPEDAVGVCEIVVRGGGIEELGQDSVLAGYRAITSLEDLIKELNVEESNNQLVLEIKSDGYLFALMSGKTKKGKDAKEGEDVKDDKDAKIGQKQEKDGLPAEDFWDDRKKSEIIAERVKNQTMQIIDTNYYVEGLLRKPITIGSKDSADPAELEAILSKEDAAAEESEKSVL